MTSITFPDLPPAAREALASPDAGQRRTIPVGPIPFSTLAWGEPFARPLLLIHGVTAAARVWWRIGPAIATTGRRVVAIDLPGHGLTGHWTGHHRFRANAVDVAAFARAAGLDRPGLQVVGHSWGAMTAAALPAVGLRPETIVLLDPPAVPQQVIARLADDPTQRTYTNIEEAAADLRAQNPTWSEGDVMAKAEALTQVDEAAARAVILENGDWDGGLADLSDPAAAEIDAWIIRGDPGCGGLLPDAALPGLSAQVGADHVITIAGAPHTPQRTHPEAVTAALVRALGG